MGTGYKSKLGITKKVWVEMVGTAPQHSVCSAAESHICK